MRYPENTARALQMTSVIRHTEKVPADDRMSTRMVAMASTLDADGFVGWQMAVPAAGVASLSAFASAEMSADDLEWAVGRIAETAPCGVPEAAADPAGLEELYELSVIPKTANSARIGFGGDAPRSEKEEDEAGTAWPMYFFPGFDELLQALRSSGALFRAVAGPASREEAESCRKTLLRTWRSRDIAADDYLGRPVRARMLLRLPGAVSIRLRTVLSAVYPGVRFRRIGRMPDPACAAAWNHPLSGAAVLPDFAARFLLLEPMAKEPVMGLETTREKAKDIPASHKGTEDPRAVCIGRAEFTDGEDREIAIGEKDLRRHTQIIGQTGTGKSTLLTCAILSAIQKGYGLTFFDPHGTTIDTILRAVPAEYAERIRVVRIGDTENPVPLNIWDSDDIGREERNISDLCELFGDIFDPKREGIVGPRYERWLSTFAKASIAVLGRRASLESIAVLSQNQENMQQVYKIIRPKYPALAEIIKEEYGKDNSHDFHQTLNWYLCKFQRLTCVEQLRKTLGAGANALDFPGTIDTDRVTLIDLASPVIGSHAARIVGTLIMQKLWNAAAARENRDRTHLVVVDEAALFQSNPVPRMLAEGRKFGLAMILCHQHAGQLNGEIRDALEANSANLCAFRLSPRDAQAAEMRFEAAETPVCLSRMDAFRAVTSLSVDGRQTEPFTLRTEPAPVRKDGERIAARIEKRSIETLVKPFRNVKALTPEEILRILEDPSRKSAAAPAPAPAEKPAPAPAAEKPAAKPAARPAEKPAETAPAQPAAKPAAAKPAVKPAPVPEKRPAAKPKPEAPAARPEPRWMVKWEAEQRKGKAG